MATATEKLCEWMLSGTDELQRALDEDIRALAQRSADPEDELKVDALVREWLTPQGIEELEELTDCSHEEADRVGLDFFARWRVAAMDALFKVRIADAIQAIELARIARLTEWTLPHRGTIRELATWLRIRVASAVKQALLRNQSGGEPVDPELN